MKLFLFLTIIIFSGCSIKNNTSVLEKQVVKKSITQPVKKIQKIQKKSNPIIKEVKKPISNDDLMILKTLNHSTIKLHASGFNAEFITPEYRKKYVLLFLFGNDCPHCIKEMPYVKKLSQNPKVKIIGIHAKSVIGDKALKAYTRKVGYNFDILSFSDDIKMIRFLKSSGFWEGGVPYSALVHPDGTIESLSVQEALSKFK